MKRYHRIFMVDEEGEVHRIPAARYERIFNRAQPIHLYAGKMIQFVGVIIELKEDQKPEAIDRKFFKCQFDAAGYWNQEQKVNGLVDACKLIDVFEDPDWRGFWYTELHCWKPSNAILEQLDLAILKERFS